MMNTELHNDTKIPVTITLMIVFICILPSLLNVFNFDFGNSIKTFDLYEIAALQKNDQIDTGYRLLSGAFTHTILEWTAFCAAIFTYALAIAHYRITNDHTTLVIAAALLCAGCMDAFHTLAADRLIDAVADNQNLIPFTWAISRTFNALILIIGVVILLLFEKRKSMTKLGLVIVSSLFFLILAYLIIDYCATSERLPQTMYPDQLITRPWDVGPLLLYLFAGLYLFPLFYRRHPSLFTASLILSMVPNVITELHMAFGSTTLFDNHFNIAHFLKIIAYVVPFVGLILDYVDTYERRIRLEQELVHKQEELQTILNDAPVMLWMTDHQGKAILFNNTWLKFTGLTQQEEISLDWSGSNIHPDDRQDCLRNYEENMRLHQYIEQEYRLQNSEGNYRWISEVAVPRFTARHQFIGYIGTCVDVTEKHEASQSLHERSRELERSNQELEQFAYIASHDLQEPLRMVSSYTQLLERRYRDHLDDDAREFIKYSVDGAKQMQSLIQDLLQYSLLSKDSIKLVYFDMNTTFDSALKNLKLLIDESNAEVKCEDLPYVYGDRSSIQQLLQNLLGNAIKYRDANRPVKVHVTARKQDDGYVFCVKDNGIGIDNQYFDRIFLIFKRLHTKEAYSGSGIGLAVCKRIVEWHGGRIWLQSTPGEGSSFFFYLPERAEP